MAGAYFTTRDGVWFDPTDLCRGPWDAGACHAGPPVGLMVRALEMLGIPQRLARVTVEIDRPVPMSGFRVTAEVQRKGRSVSTAKARIHDDDKLYATAHALHIRSHEPVEYPTVPDDAPDIANAEPGAFPIRDPRHDLASILDSWEVLYDPGGSQGTGGPTTIWMRSVAPILADEEPSGFQRICPLADSGNGISYNAYLDTTLFVNADLTLALHREPTGEWFCARSKSHWQADGIGLADSELFDTSGAVGRSLQTLILKPA